MNNKKTITLNLDKTILNEFLEKAEKQKNKIKNFKEMLLKKQKNIALQDKTRKLDEELKKKILLKIQDRDEYFEIERYLADNKNIFLNPVFEAYDFNKIFFYLLKNNGIELYRKFLDNGFPLDGERDKNKYAPAIIMACTGEYREQFLTEMIGRGLNKVNFTNKLIEYVKNKQKNGRYDLEKFYDFNEKNKKPKNVYWGHGDDEWNQKTLNKDFVIFCIKNNFNLTKIEDLSKISEILNIFNNFGNPFYDIDKTSKKIDSEIIIIKYFFKNKKLKDYNDYKNKLWNFCAITDNVELLETLNSNNFLKLDGYNLESVINQWGSDKINILELFLKNNAEKCVKTLINDKNLILYYKREISKKINKNKRKLNIKKYKAKKYENGGIIVNTLFGGNRAFLKTNHMRTKCVQNYSNFLKIFKITMSLINKKFLDDNDFLKNLFYFYLFWIYKTKDGNEKNYIKARVLIDTYLKFNKNSDIKEIQKKEFLKEISQSEWMLKNKIGGYEDKKDIILMMKYDLERNILEQKIVKNCFNKKSNDIDKKSENSKSRIFI